ncbi:hypothetical protein [Pontivivens insulae]|uniref:Uncharacterized protein n=1 Tax=Pontivivens insulae TaxID=1639689 RepID=A0A2R8ABG0_9RHOB|nr:hypothetical protein [Pontivivens insulae]RED11261.1 hypothetical protein DFR53_3295 [Pontivivens insulae]SPF29566.1 hypothetical protein POI8812_01878 [Pontivivens insulae]
MSRFELSSTFATSPERVWANLKRTALLRYICAPRVTFRIMEPTSWPEEWEERDYRMAARFYGMMPSGVQSFRVEYPDTTAGRYALRQTAEGLNGWDHVMMVEPEGKGTRYTDVLNLTGPASLIAGSLYPSFFRHRHTRWQQLIANGFDYSAGPDPLEGHPA